MTKEDPQSSDFGKSYELKLNERQARVLCEALEFYSRVGIGQFGEILRHPDIRSRWMSFGDFDLVEAERRVRELKDFVTRPGSEIYPQPVRINSHEQIAWDIHQVVRHRLAWDRANNPPERTSEMFQTIYDEPVQRSKEPLAIMTGKISTSRSEQAEDNTSFDNGNEAKF